MDGWPFGWVSSTMDIPEGYELVEKPEYKKQKLEKYIEVLKREIKYYERNGASLREELAENEKDLEKLG